MGTPTILFIFRRVRRLFTCRTVFVYSIIIIYILHISVEDNKKKGRIFVPDTFPVNYLEAALEPLSALGASASWGLEGD